MGTGRKTGKRAGNTGRAGDTESTGSIGHENAGNTGTSAGGTGTERVGEGAAQPPGLREMTGDTPAVLEAEAAAAIATAPVEPAAPGMPVETGPTPADIEAGYRLIGDAILGATFNTVCPAWQVTEQEKGKLAGALAHAAQLWFPEAIPEKWVALIVVAGVGFEIIGARRDPNTGLLAPRFNVKPAPPAAPAETH
jgi:hypothetical protein